MSLAHSQSVLVLVDEANFAGTARDFSRKPEWDKLRTYLADPTENRQLIEMVGYVGLPPEGAEEFRVGRTNKLRFVMALRNQGFLVVLKEGRPTQNGKFTANVDVLMAVDGFRLAVDLKPDVVVLVTGDHEFSHLAETLRRSGIRVEVASVANNLSGQLRAAANSVIDLQPLLNEMAPSTHANGREPSLSGNLDTL